MTIGERIRLVRENADISQVDLATRIDVAKQTLYKYENNIITNIPSDKIEKIAQICKVTPAFIMGWENDENNIVPLPQTNVFMRPIYDSAAAGFNVLAQNTIVGYMPTYIKAPSEQDKYIWVNVVGDSMSPLIDDGAKVLVKKQESIDSGQIAVVLIDGEEAVVKKVNYGKDWIELISVNPYYPPRRFEGPDVQSVRIIGLVKEVSKTLN